MHGILSYEERVRLERANGIRPANKCAPCADGCNQSDAHLKGMTYEDMALMPQPLRRVCPHPKVIVPVTPVLMIDEPVKRHTPKFGEAKWRVADFNECDARNQGLYAIPNDATIEHANTVMKATTRVVDNPFDQPHEVTTIKSDIEANGNAVQPIATNATTADPKMGTEDGKTLVPVTDLDQEQD